MASSVAGGGECALDVESRGSQFVDREGRRLTLRGVNLAGGKVPRDGPTHRGEDLFSTARTKDYVGRPFPLSDAGAHFRRLRAWGFNVVRLVVTWDALEHGGPGVYDREYVAYVVGVVEAARPFGLSVIVDPHQDVWSRFSGGSGAPAWTFAAVGLDVEAFAATGAALVHATCEDPAHFPRMCWPTNKDKLACFTMFTVFFAGDRFAPDLRVAGEPAQRYLQRHYCDALGVLAAALAHCPNVVGFGSMNEPLPGLVGKSDLSSLDGPLRNGRMPTPFEAMATGSGHALPVGVYAIDSLWTLALGRAVRAETANPSRASAWLPGKTCVWRAHGVWGEDAAGAPVLRAPRYFDVGPDYFGDACFRPFLGAYASAIRAKGHSRWKVFVELPPADLGLCAFPDLTAAGGRPAPLADGATPAYVHAPHWYDQLTLFFGASGRRRPGEGRAGTPPRARNVGTRRGRRSTR